MSDVKLRRTVLWFSETVLDLNIEFTCYSHKQNSEPKGTFKQWHTVGGFGVFNPPKFRRPSKIVPNSTRLWKLLKIAEFRMPTHQDVRGKKDSKILKLRRFANRFTLAMTNKFVVIINSLKVPKIKKILLYEMKFLVPYYSCLQNSWLGGYRVQIPIFSVLCPQLNLLNPPPTEQNSWVRYCF